MNLEGFKPLLAVQADLDTLRFPCYASPKLDGIRCVTSNGVAYSRNLKPIPNAYIQSKIAEYADILEALDGELIVGSPTDPKCFNTSTSAIMSRDGEPDFKFYVFDRVGEGSYDSRYLSQDIASKLVLDFVQFVPQIKVANHEQLSELESKLVGFGYEGVMLRSPEGRYKFGRSTAKEQILLKVKRFEDCELEICGFEERMHNANEATINALGHTERSSHKENMVGRGDLGALICKSGDDTVNVGSGFTDEQRAEIWANREFYLGKWAKIKHQPSGAKDKLRFPVYLGIRDERDMS